MTAKIKQFIENNIDTLEKDVAEFFVTCWEQSALDSSDVAYMAFVLYTAGIEDVNEYRDQALVRILDDRISEFGLAESGVSAMPIEDFIGVFLDNCIGYTQNYVTRFMFNHQQRWKNWVNLFVDSNKLPIIERST